MVDSGISLQNGDEKEKTGRSFLKKAGLRIRSRWWMLLIIFLLWGWFAVSAHPLAGAEQWNTLEKHTTGFTDPVDPGQTVVQHFRAYRDNLSGFNTRFKFDTANPGSHIEISVYNPVNGEQLADSILTNTGNNVADIMTISIPVQHRSKGKEYEIRITPLDGSAVDFYITEPEENQDLFVEGRKLNADLQFEAEYTLSWMRYVLIGINAVTALLTAAAVLLIGNDLKKNYVILCVLVCPAIMLMRCPNFIDESTHLFRAFAIANGNFTDVFLHGKIGAYVPANFQDMVTNTFRNQLSLPSAIANFHQWKQPFSRTTTFVANDLMSSYIPFAHIPAAIGLWIGWHLSLPAFVTIWLGRFTNFLTYAVLGYYAVTISHKYRTMLFGLVTLPIMSSFAVSVTADTLLNTCVILYMAICLKYLCDDKSGRVRMTDIMLMALCTVAVTSTKYLLYSPILLLFFLIPREKFRTKRNRTETFLFLLLLVVLVAFFQLTLLQKFPYTETRNGNVNVAEQLSFIKKNPLLAFQIFTIQLRDNFEAFTLIHQSPLVPFSNLVFAPLEILAPVAALAGTVMAPDKYDFRSHRIMRRTLTVLIPLFLALIAFLIVASLYCGYTPVGKTSVDGVQERYFFPLMAMLFFWLSLVIDGKHTSGNFNLHITFWIMMGSVELYARYLSALKMP